MKLKLPFHHRVYFFVRKWAIRTVRGAIWITQKLHWYWAAFKLMEFQRWMGWRYTQ